MSEKRIKKIHILDVEKYDAGFPPENFNEFIQWNTNILYNIPKEYRDTAKIEIDSVASYEDSHYATIEVSYSRPETDQELSDRLSIEKKQAVEKEHKERETLSLLKQKYEILNVPKSEDVP